MLVVIPVCAKDKHLALANLAWCIELDRNAPFDVVISHETGFEVADVKAAAERYFQKVHTVEYEPWRGSSQSWPFPQNWAWQSTARLMSQFEDSWLWWEQDATPLKAAWLTQLSDFHKAGNRPFTGYIVNGLGNMNGVAVYPAKVSQYCIRAFLCRQAAFDVVLTHDIGESAINKANHLIAHVPKMNGSGVYFGDRQSVTELLATDAVLFHGCEDTSLIKVLSKTKPEPPAKSKRSFYMSMLKNPVDEAELWWQQERETLSDKGYAVGNVEQFKRVYPSLFEQSYEGGLFNQIAPTRTIVFYNCALGELGETKALVARRWVRHGEKHWASSLVKWTVNSDMTLSDQKELKFPHRAIHEQREDPRITGHDGKWYLSYCSWFADREFRARQIFARFTANWDFETQWEIPYGQNQKGAPGHEKNWIWFNHEGEWYFVYSFHPHIVVQQQDGSVTAELKTSMETVPWAYGEIRGGTNPVRFGDEYFSFFHSSMPWQGRQKRYYCGAYAFEAQYPFAITRITTEPLLVASEDDTRILGGPLVVFPCGAILNNGIWIISFGVNDEACGYAKLSHATLMDQMITTKPGLECLPLLT